MQKLILVGSLLLSQVAYCQEILVDKRQPEVKLLDKKQQQSLIQQDFNDVKNTHMTEAKVSILLDSFHKDQVVDPEDVAKAQMSLEQLQKSLYLQQMALKQKRQEYENAQTDFFNALNDKSKILAKKEQDIAVLGLEVTVGLDKIENTKKELDQALINYKNKYQQLTQVEQVLQQKEEHLNQLENNLANQDIILITKSENMDSLVSEVSKKTTLVAQQKEQLQQQSNEILRLKKELAKQQTISQTQAWKNNDIKKSKLLIEDKSNLKIDNVKEDKAQINQHENIVKKTNTLKVKKVFNKTVVEKDKKEQKDTFKEEKAQINIYNQMNYSDTLDKNLKLPAMPIVSLPPLEIAIK